MSILAPTPEFEWLRADAKDLDRKLREGDGLGFPGDPRLVLAQGVITAEKSGYSKELGRIVRRGDIVARRWEVWRHCEDGVDRMIGHWRMHEFDRILLDLTSMRLDSPGHEDTLSKIDKANDAKDKEVLGQMRDVLGEFADHTARLIHDTTGPRDVFHQMPGRRDASPGEASGTNSTTPEES